MKGAHTPASDSSPLAPATSTPLRIAVNPTLPPVVPLSVVKMTMVRSRMPQIVERS